MKPPEMLSVLLLSALCLGAALTGCSGSSSPTGQATQATAKKYTCPMHPDVVSDQPGKCPKCGMTLVEKN